MRWIMLLLAGAICVVSPHAKAAEPIQVRLGILSGAAQAALVVAVEKGFFAQHGFAVEARPLVGGVQGNQAIAAGQVDWSAGGVEPTIIAAASSLPFKPYAMYAKGGDSYGVLARKNAGITTVQDLAGKTVALTPGTAPVQGFEQLLQSGGVPAGSVHRVNASFTTMGQMLIQGAVDAMVGIEPYLTLTQQELQANGVMVSRLGRFVQGGGFFYISDAWAAAHPDKIEDAVAALWDAEQFVRHNPQEAASIEATFIKANPSVIQATFQYLRFDPTIDDFTVKAFDGTAAYLLKGKLIPHAVSAADVLAPAIKMEATLRQKMPEALQ